MRVLHVVPTYEPAWKTGGVVRATSQLCRGLATLGVDVTVYTTDSNGQGWLQTPTDKPVTIGGVNVHYFHTPFPKAFRFSLPLAHQCSMDVANFDIIHIASFWNYPGIAAAAAAIRRCVPYVISTHGTLAPYALHQGALKKRVYFGCIDKPIMRHASAIHCTSDLELSDVRGLGLNVPIFVVPNGMDFHEFADLPDRDSARRRLGLGQDQVVLTYLGRLNAIKGLDVLVTAFGKISALFPSAILLIVGPDDGFLNVLKHLVWNSNLESKVRFIGFIHPKDRNMIFSASDLSISLSSSENFCYSAVEAMAAGLPVMISQYAGISEQIREDDAGIVVSPQPDKVAEALVALLSDPEKLRNIGSRARESVHKRYDIRQICQQMVRAYEEVLSRAQSAAARVSKGGC